jgi:hypothetical protein
VVRLGRAKQEDRERFAKYRAVGRGLLATARDLESIGDAKYGNGLAIIAIHAAIAYTDALTVAYREIRSTDEVGGKSGGARVVYRYVQARETIYLLLAFAKNVQANLTADQKVALRNLVAKLKKEA